MVRLANLMILIIAILAFAGCYNDSDIQVPEGESLLSFSLQALDGSLDEGMTREDVEEYFVKNEMYYLFYPRKRVEFEVPKIQWACNDDIGIYRAWIPLIEIRRKKNSPIPAISVDVLVGGDGVVSKIVFQNFNSYF